MAAPSYTTDLTTITQAESGSIVELTGFTNGVPQSVPETDLFIQGTGCMSSTTPKTGGSSIAYDNGSGFTVPTDGAVLLWQWYGAPNSLDTYANGGQQVGIGNSSSAFYQFYTGGSDRNPMPYGGWKNVAVDPNQTAARDATTGSPSGTWQVAGIMVYCPTTVPSKGAPLCMDAIRYGRCQYRVNGGDGTSGYATFAGMAQTNDYNDATNGYNRWGLFREVQGTYLWKGLITLGYTSAVDFRDSNRVILIDDTPKVSSNFNKIDIDNASSRVDWTNISIKALGTNAPGNFEVVTDCDVNFDSCSFVDMGTFIFGATSSVLSCVFRGCGQITANGGNFTGSLVTGYEGTSDTSAMVWNVATNPNALLDDMTFVKGTASTHAIEFGTSSPTTMTLNGVTLTGYNASNGQTDSALYFARTSGTVTVNLTGMSTPSYKSAGATITFVSSVTITLTGLKNPTEVRVFYAGTQTEYSGTGAENVTTGTHAFSVSSGTSVDIRLISLGYQIMSILAYSSTSNATLPISQVIDRQYENP